MYIKVNEKEMIKIMKDRLDEQENNNKSFVRKYFINKYMMYDIRQSFIRYSIQGLLNGLFMYMGIKLSKLGG